MSTTTWSMSDSVSCGQRSRCRWPVCVWERPRLRPPVRVHHPRLSPADGRMSAGRDVSGRRAARLPLAGRGMRYWFVRYSLVQSVRPV